MYNTCKGCFFRLNIRHVIKGRYAPISSYPRQKVVWVINMDGNRRILDLCAGMKNDLHGF